MRVVPVRAVVCLALWLSAYRVSGAYLTPEMNKTIQNLLQLYKISPRDRFDGKPVFSKEPLNGRMEMKRVFMGGVLETYEKLLGHMLKQPPTPSPQTAGDTAAAANAIAGAGSGVSSDTRAQLTFILTKVKRLRENGYQEQDKLLKGLHALKHIQMESFVVQSKALLELPWLYDEASSLVENLKTERRRRRRRRRQARRTKAHPRA